MGKYCLHLYAILPAIAAQSLLLVQIHQTSGRLAQITVERFSLAETMLGHFRVETGPDFAIAAGSPGPIKIPPFKQGAKGSKLVPPEIALRFPTGQEMMSCKLRMVILIILTVDMIWEGNTLPNTVVIGKPITSQQYCARGQGLSRARSLFGQGTCGIEGISC